MCILDTHFPTKNDLLYSKTYTYCIYKTKIKFETHPPLKKNSAISPKKKLDVSLPIPSILKLEES